MGCILFILALLMPRIAMVFIFLLTTWFQRAYDTVLWPVLGFIFMPYTTLAWMGATLQGGARGVWLLLLILAVIVDVGHLMGGGHSYGRRRRR